ncbi:MAG TPA: STAS domain-containing protein [Acetobacteraceae bacterium]
MSETQLKLEGRLDSNAIPLLERRLADAVRPGNEDLLLDMTLVTFLGSLGLRAILTAARRLAGSGGRLAVCGSPEMARVFAVSGIDRVVAVRGTLAEARAALATGRLGA